MQAFQSPRLPASPARFSILPVNRPTAKNPPFVSTLNVHGPSRITFAPVLYVISIEPLVMVRWSPKANGRICNWRVRRWANVYFAS